MYEALASRCIVTQVEPALFLQLSGWNDVFLRYADIADDQHPDGHKIGIEGLVQLVNDLWKMFPREASADEGRLQQEAALALSRMDSDGDGQITFAELLTYAQSRLSIFEPLVAVEHQRRTGQQYAAH